MDSQRCLRHAGDSFRYGRLTDEIHSGRRSSSRGQVSPLPVCAIISGASVGKAGFV